MKEYIQILESLSNNNKYFRIYSNICERSFKRSKPEISEKHHILPVSFKMGGEKNFNNIAILTPREHFICHKLLVKFIIDKKLKSKMAYSAWQLTQRHEVCSREYEALKKLISETYKGIPKSELHKEALRKPKSNKSNMGRSKGCSNPTKGIKRPHVGLNISRAKKGKTVGADNHFYGKKHSDETKLKMINSLEKFGNNKPWLSQESIKKRSEKRKGIPTHNSIQVTYNGITYRSIRKCAEANGVSKHFIKKMLKNITG